MMKKIGEYGCVVDSWCAEKICSEAWGTRNFIIITVLF